MQLPLLTMRMRGVFVLLLVTGLVVVVLSGLLIGIIQHIKHNVDVLSFSESGLIDLVQKDSRIALILLIVLAATVALFLVSYFLAMLGAARREIELCAKLIKQDEATRQAETKSMKKSDAITSASHDVRNALVCMTELIRMTSDDVSQGSSLAIKENLTQMDTCTKHLLGILSSILDNSKIEAGKMVLEEAEFDVAQLVEEVVDFFLPTGLKKGIDVVLDPYDCSLLNFANVKGDRGRLKQILNNILGNAVKFTSEGHVTVRAWVRKPSFVNSITAASSSQGSSGLLKHLMCFFRYKNAMSKEQLDDMEAVNMLQHDPNSLEYVFEVDDTGRGIPKEKQKQVFENYVQVKESAHGEGGTGLGLGIVQSLVRLMHGEIGIVDKEIGAKGTCFRFNVLLRTTNVCEGNTALEQDLEAGDRPSFDDSNQQMGLIASSSPGLNRISRTPSPKCTPVGSPGLSVFRSASISPKAEESIVVLLIKNEERRRIVHGFMKNTVGIKVVVVQEWGELAHTLKSIELVKMKKGYSSQHQQSSSSGIHDLGLQDNCLSKSTLCNSSNRAKEAYPLKTAMDGTYNNMLSLFKKIKTNLTGTSSFILLVIDTTAGPYPELCKVVTDFKRRLKNAWCKCVWLENSQLHGMNISGLDQEDFITKKALHGTRLIDVVRILPEYGGALPNRSTGGIFRVGSLLESAAPSSSGHYKSEMLSSQTQHDSKPRNSPVGPDRPSPRREMYQHGKTSTPLRGKRFLVAEDNAVMGKLVMITLVKEGATVRHCKNGREALELVQKDLTNQGRHEYDYILMDCEMPEMDGFEATRQIRQAETSYHVRVPVIALTAHEPGEETRRMLDAGMDDYLNKPLKVDRLLDKITRLVRK